MLSKIPASTITNGNLPMLGPNSTVTARGDYPFTFHMCNGGCQEHIPPEAIAVFG